MSSNVAASVRARLSNQAKEKKRPFQELLQYYGIERFLSEAPIVILVASFLLSSPHTSNRTGVAARDAAGNEMTPRARVRGLLNRLPLICELPLEGPRFDSLA
jgi:hypothetical protein